MNSNNQQNLVGKLFSKLLTPVLQILVLSYKVLGAPHMGGTCRFEPSCSQYALDALKEHNAFFATKLIIVRIFKCRPGGSFGFDPIPHKLKKGLQ